MLSLCFTEISVIDAVLPDSAYYYGKGVLMNSKGEIVHQ